MDLKLYNTLSRRGENFIPLDPPKVGVYTCGPTVYNYVTVGNWRTYTLGDLVARVLKYSGYQTDYIMNITDVGHLTGDNLGDADIGEDKLEKTRNNMLYFNCKNCGKISPTYISVDRKSFKTLTFINNYVNCSFCSSINRLSKGDVQYRDNRITAWDIAKFYTEDFLKGYKKLNLTKPRLFCKATDHIKEQIELVLKIESKGFTYKISDGIYFDVGAYEAIGNKYGQLSTLDKIKEGARVEPNPEKKDPRDFCLWKFSPRGQKRHMEWQSPWGIGFPGWHIECSAMSMKYLGEQFDIHIGGEDLKSTHHPNEIVQSEAASGKKPFVKYWIHGAFLQVGGGRMGKSLGNAYTLDDIEKKGFNPLALRYFYLTGYYRKPLNFTWQALKGAQQALDRLYGHLRDFHQESRQTTLSEEKMKKIDLLRLGFTQAINNDFRMPEAISVVWQVVKSNIPSPDKYDLLIEWDQVLGLNLEKASKALEGSKAGRKVRELVENREELRRQKRWKEADKARKEIEKKGFVIEDTKSGPKIKTKR